MLVSTMRARGARTTATFRAFDEDGDGRINFSEMKLALNSLLGLADGNTIAEETVAHVFRAFDTSPAGSKKEGEININELSAQILGHGTKQRHASVHEEAGYLSTLKRRETEIRLENERDRYLRSFVSNFEESRGAIRGVFRDQDDDHNNLLSGQEFLDALTGANFNLDPTAALYICTWFFGESTEEFDAQAEMTFSDFAQKVSQLSMLPRFRGEI
jgi:Ca2+-binding EF-hand superfamily protein